MNIKQLKVIITLISPICLIYSCTYDKLEPGIIITDSELYSLAIDSGYTFYKNNPNPLASANGSAHGNYNSVRFNMKAQASLDNQGKLPPGAVFPDSSVIVKEIFSQKDGQPNLYAVMLKLSGAAYNSESWLWAEYALDGSVIVSLKEKGRQCVSCHNSEGNRDLVRTFALH